MQQTPTRLRTGSPNPKDPSLQGILVELASADADGFFICLLHPEQFR